MNLSRLVATIALSLSPYGKTLSNGTEILSGEITDMSKLNGKVLTQPTYSVTANQHPAHAGEYWSTFYHPAASFQVGTNEKAYIGTVNGSSVTLTEITDGIIPANTAVVLKATSGNFDLTRTADNASTFDVTTNELKGGATVETGKVPYTLAAKNNVVGFYKFTGAELNPNKAHLEVDAPTQQAPEYFGFDIEDDDADGINGLTPDPSLLRRGEIYNLSGQKLNKPQKGIIIVNGRKVLF